MTKVKIKKIISKFGLSSFFERLNFFRQKRIYRKSNSEFLRENPKVLLPPDFYIYETFSASYKKYYNGGYETAEWLYNHLSEFKILKNISILDWGCGPGRILRHLPSIAPDNFYFGCDYNEKYVRWCSDNIDDVLFKKNELSPPLDFADNFFDVIYGISIFTHLSEKMHYKWMSELYRVLKKEGIIFLTTHGSVTKQKLSKKEKEAFDNGCLVVHEYKEEGNRLFAAYQPYDFFKNLCEQNNLKILTHIPGEIRNNKPQQDIWILSKS